MSKSIRIQGKKVALIPHENEDYVCLTDITKSLGLDGSQVDGWLRNKNTLEYLAVWESLNNPNFNSLEFEGIRNEAGTNRFAISSKEWISKTSAIGIVARAGRYGGTFAHKDIALEFASWLSPTLRLYIVKEFQRLKEEENRYGDPEWGINRTLAKINFRLQTDAVKRRLIPPNLPKKKIGFVYANEADVVNVAITGMTAKEWRTANPDKDGNLRDYLSVEQLLVLANIESYNSILIDQGMAPNDRVNELNAIARDQMKAITAIPAVKSLKAPPLLKRNKDN